MEELRAMVVVDPPQNTDGAAATEGLHFQHMIGNVANLIANPINAGAVFQAASQFNCLEMVSPRVSPKDGVTRYQWDHTQGPACAIACPAGTVYRNYLVHNGLGQKERQINTLADVESVLGTKYWEMQNGYAMPLEKHSMADLGKRLVGSCSENFEEVKARLRGEQVRTERKEDESEQNDISDLVHKKLRVGVHWDTMVGATQQHRKDPTTGSWVTSMQPAEHRVAQVYASACPVSYDRFSSSAEWGPFAQLVLSAAYDATLLAARVLSKKRGGARVKVFLTKLCPPPSLPFPLLSLSLSLSVKKPFCFLLILHAVLFSRFFEYRGDGAFGNETKWIVEAVQNALKIHSEAPLDVFLVHYGSKEAILPAEQLHTVSFNLWEWARLKSI